MFIKTQLEKEIKKMYFKHYFNEYSQELLCDYKKFYNVCQNESDVTGMNLLHDIIYPISEYKSKLAKDLEYLRKDYSKRVYKSFNNLPNAKAVGDILVKYSTNSYLVGGAVRDSILMKNSDEVKDWDFVTDITYDKLRIIFEENGYNVKETGKEFLVMKMSKDGYEIDISNFRKDGSYQDGRRPESVDIGTIHDDAERRDFTINALFYNIHSNMLEDPTSQGILDMQSKTLRFVGKPKDRLKEDSLRAWRFFRFVKNLNFNADKKSASAIKENFKTIYDTSNPQRVLQELSKFINV